MTDTTGTATQIRAMLREIWPDLKEIWCFDQNYQFPTGEDVARALKVSGVNFEKQEGEVFDCDDYALQLHAEIKRKRMGWAFGEAFGSKIRGWPRYHVLNICCTMSGVLLIEPKTDEMWQPNPTADNLLFVRM